MKEGLRRYLVANMFDGDESGTTTRPVKFLLDDIVDCVALFILGDDTERIEAYFTEPA